MKFTRWTILSSLALFAIAVFADHFSPLFDWFITPQAGIHFIRVALIAIVIHSFALAVIPQKWRLYASVAIGNTALLLLIGWKATIASAFFIFVISALADLPLNLPVRYIIVVGLGAAGLYLRGREPVDFSVWWIYIFWLRTAARILDYYEEKPATERPWETHAKTLAFYTSPPFLIGPLALVWLPWSDFRNRLEFAPTLEKAKHGAFLCWLGLLYLAADDFFRVQLTSIGHFAFNFEMLSSLHGNGVNHLAAGFLFFCFTFWQLAGLSAIAAGAWQIAGCSIRYQFDKPFLSRSVLDFWRRRLFYARELILRVAYWPSFIWMSRYLPASAAFFLAVSIVFLPFYAAAHLMEVPLMPGGVPFQKISSVSGAFKHGFCMWSIVWISFGFGKAFEVARKLTKLDLLFHGLEIVFTLILLSAFFYSAFAFSWMNWTVWEFLQALGF